MLILPGVEWDTGDAMLAAGEIDQSQRQAKMTILRQFETANCGVDSSSWRCE